MKIVKLLPGVALSVVIALLSCWLESLLPIHLIGSAVIAMFIGMFLNQRSEEHTSELQSH